VKINFYAAFRQIVGGKSVTLSLEEGCTVKQLLRAVVGDYPALGPALFDEQGELLPYVRVFVNGRDAPQLPDAMETKVASSDTIDIFPPIGGG